MGSTPSKPSSTARGTMSSAFLVSQHGASFVSSLLSSSSAKNVGVLPSGTVLTSKNAVEQFQYYLSGQTNESNNISKKAYNICLSYLITNFTTVLASEYRNSIFELPVEALALILESDELSVNELLLYVVVGVWADRQVTLAAGEPWELPELPSKESAKGSDCADDGNTDAPDKTETENDVEIPEWKFDEDYTRKLRDAMAPLLPHIRFPAMSTRYLSAIEQEGNLVPRFYLTEAYRHQALRQMDTYKPDEKNPRLRGRKMLTDPEWSTSLHGQHIQVSADGKTVTKISSSWYSVAVAKDGYDSDVHKWAIKVEGDEVYIGVTENSISQLDNYLGAESAARSYIYNGHLYTSGSNTRTYGESFGRGDYIGVVLDMTEMTLSFFKNGKSLGQGFTNLPRTKLFPAVGWRDGSMTFVELIEH